MNKEQAIKFLKRAGVRLSVRTMQRAVERGQLAVAYVPGPKGEQADFAEAELTRFATERKTVTHRARVTGDNGTADTSGTAQPTQALVRREAQPDAVALLLAAIQRGSERNHVQPSATVSLADKLRLTIPEAVAYTGLGRAELERAIKAGKLKPEHRGPHGARVILRTELEKLK
jgi:hypothetical protein